MKKILVNYADKSFSASQKLNSKSALEVGGFDEVFSFAPEDIDAVFFKENKKLLSEFRGNGYWLWKPYFILRVLEEARDGDWVFYCDSGAFFVDNIDHLIACAERASQDVLVFEIPYIEKEWTKRDAFILMGCDSSKYIDTLQRCSGFVLFRKSKLSIAFAEQWLEYQKDKRIVSDDNNVLGKENYEGFQENRHDQTVLSLLSKKYNLIGLRDPSQLGNEMMKDYKNSPYPQIVVSTRKRNFFTRVVHKIKRTFGLNVYERFEFKQLLLQGMKIDNK